MAGTRTEGEIRQRRAREEEGTPSIFPRVAPSPHEISLPSQKTRIEARSVTWAQKITVSKQKEEVEYRGRHHRIALLLRTMN